MDFNKTLVDIILNEKHDGEKDIDWLYGEYVKRGYNKSREMFCEEFVMSMNEQEIKYLTESEVNKVTGGAGKFKKSSTSIALASALLAGSMMPAQGAGVPESRAVVSANISNKHQGKSNQGFYEKATRIVNKIFNDADVRSVLVPVLAAVGVPVLGASTIYLTSRIVKRISEAETPEAVLKNTKNGLNDILNNKQSSNQKDEILTTLKICLLKLIDFVPNEQQSNLKGLYVEKFGKKEQPKVFNNWDELKKAFTDVLGAINNELKLRTETSPLNRLFEERKNDLTEVFDSKEEPKKEETNPEEPKKEEKKESEKESETESEGDTDILEDSTALLPHCTSIFDSNYDVDMNHDSYTTKELTNNAIVSKETGINKEVLDIVDKKVDESPKGKLSRYNLTEDVLLVVCKKMDITTKTLGDPLQGMMKDNPEKNLYLVLKDCSVNYTELPSINVTVLDLRGTTCFGHLLGNMNSVDKVLLRNQNSSGRQLILYECRRLGAIYQMTAKTDDLSSSRLRLVACTLGKTFRFVNLNKKSPKLLTRFCMNQCKCPANSRNKILTDFDPKYPPTGGTLQDV